MLCAWARRNSLHDGPLRRGAGPRPERLRIDLIVVAPIRMPSLRSSPWIRTQPHLEFSRARRSTSSRSAGSIRGRPGKRRRYVHFLAMSSRCQRSSVCDETTNTDHRSLGKTALAAASSSRSRRRSGRRLPFRRNTASSWRSTAFSTSNAATDEPRAMTRSSLRTAKWIRKKNTSRSYGRNDSAHANRSFCALHAQLVISWSHQGRIRPRPSRWCMRLSVSSSREGFSVLSGLASPPGCSRRRMSAMGESRLELGGRESGSCGLEVRVGRDVHAAIGSDGASDVSSGGSVSALAIDSTLM